jgi:hypothetical protein
MKKGIKRNKQRDKKIERQRKGGLAQRAKLEGKQH